LLIVGYAFDLSDAVVLAANVESGDPNTALFTLSVTEVQATL
jgi:hypothetical protein